MNYDKVTRAGTYKVSEKVTLKKGDYFRTRGGPYYLSEHGFNMSMSVRGPFVFMGHCTRDDNEWIEAWSVSEHAMAVLPLTDRQSCLPGTLIARPYEIVGGVRKKTAMRLDTLVVQDLPQTKRLARRNKPSQGVPAFSNGTPEAVVVDAVAQGKAVLKKVFGGE